MGPGWGGSGPREKTRYPKRGGSGPRVLPHGLGPGMKKPGPNPTRCHSQLQSAQQHTFSEKLQNGLWSLYVPNKVKNLMWRACRNAMPTKANLVRRTISDDPLYNRCHEAHETALHAIQMCKEVDVIWADPELWSCRREVHFLNFKGLLSWMIEQQNNAELFAMTAWMIWRQRNQVRLNQATCNVD